MAVPLPTLESLLREINSITIKHPNEKIEVIVNKYSKVFDDAITRRMVFPYLQVASDMENKFMNISNALNHALVKVSSEDLCLRLLLIMSNKFSLEFNIFRNELGNMQKIVSSAIRNINSHKTQITAIMEEAYNNIMLFPCRTGRIEDNSYPLKQATIIIPERKDGYVAYHLLRLNLGNKEKVVGERTAYFFKDIKMLVDLSLIQSIVHAHGTENYPYRETSKHIVTAKYELACGLIKTSQPMVDWGIE